MEYHQVRRVPVVNDQGPVVGVVCGADLALGAGPSEPPEERLFVTVARRAVLSNV
jgi:hypothetical protein